MSCLKSSGDLREKESALFTYPIVWMKSKIITDRVTVMRDGEYVRNPDKQGTVPRTISSI